MYLAQSPDQEAFAHECRRLLEKEWSPSLAREVATPAGSGHHHTLHRRLAGSGWLDIAAAPPATTHSGSLVELGLAYQEAGRALVPTTLYSCVFAALLLRRCDASSTASDLLADLVAGETLATVAYLEDGAESIEDVERYATVAVKVGSGWILDGRKSYVLNAATANRVLVAARVGDEDFGSGHGHWGLFVVDTAATGVSEQPHQTFGHDSQSTVTFDGVALEQNALVAGPFDAGQWAAFFGAVVDEATALLCMEMVGGAQKVLDDTVAYVGQRIAFGRPIGTFQAVQHQLADVAISVSAARVASMNAVWAASTDAGAAREVSIAKSWVSSAYKDATLVAHQLYGGAGYVREADLCLWSQRAKATEPLFGGRTYHLRRLATIELEPTPLETAEVAG